MPLSLVFRCVTPHTLAPLAVWRPICRRDKAVPSWGLASSLPQRPLRRISVHVVNAVDQWRQDLEAHARRAVLADLLTLVRICGLAMQARRTEWMLTVALSLFRGVSPP